MNFLKLIRNTSFVKYALWTVIFAFLALIFFVWGGAGQQEGRGLFGAEYVVYVDGDTYPPHVLRQRYLRQVADYKRYMGDSFNNDFIKDMAARLADSMVNQLIMCQIAREMGMTVGDKEIAATIQKANQFENPGEEYPEMLSRMGLTPEEFESSVRADLLMDKLNSLFEDTTVLGEEELLRRYTEQNERYKALVSFAKTAGFKSKIQQPTEEEILALYEAEKDTLSVPEKRTIRFVQISEVLIRKNLEIPEAEVKAFYESHKDQYATPADQRRASHILLKTNKDMTEEDKQVLEKKVEEIMDRALAGEEFAALAGQYSEDSSAAKGGDLNWFDRSRMVPPFAEAVFDTCKKVGDIVGPVETRFGYHVVKLTGIGGQPKPFADVEAQVRSQMMVGDPATMERLKELYEKARQEFEAVLDEAGMNQYASDWQLKVTPVTRPFDEDDPIQGIGLDETLTREVFAAEKDVWVPPLDFRNGKIRFVVNTIEESHPASFEEVKGDLRIRMVEERAEAKALESVEALAAVGEREAFEKKAGELGIKAEETSSLRSIDSLPAGIGAAPEIAEKLMASEVGTTVGPIEHEKGWVVAHITDHVKVDPEKYEEQKQQFAQREIQTLATQMINDLVAERRVLLEEKEAIRFNQEYIESLDRVAADKG